MISEPLYYALRLWRQHCAGFTLQTRQFGLCAFVNEYAPGYQGELKRHLSAELGDSCWPFNGHSPSDYEHEENKGANPKRRAWVDAKIAEYENS